jgi:hypothetical protein
MIKKEIMLENINKEINHLGDCIKDLEYQKQFIQDLDNDMEKLLKNNIKSDDENFLMGIVENNELYILFSKYSHLYQRNFKI